MPETVDGFLALSVVDGGLIGGASLNVDDFAYRVAAAATIR